MASLKDMLCGICEEDNGEKTVQVSSKGLPNLIKASQVREDGKWESFNKDSLPVVHATCRRKYTHPTELSKFNKKIHNDESQSSKDILRSKNEEVFNFKTQCFFCVGSIDLDVLKHKKKLQTIRSTATLSLKNTILACCKERNDEWSREVHRRICNEMDLVAAEAKYHASCYSLFLKGKTNDKLGRPLDDTLENAFTNLCQGIESDKENCQFSIKELLEKLKSYLPHNTEPWSEKHFKLRLKKKYQDNIIITEIPGKPSVLCLKNNCEQLVSEEWLKQRNNRKNNPVEERIFIVKAAARILREDIRGMVSNLDEYPSCDDVKSGGNRFFPNSLDVFFEELLLKEKKSALYDTKVSAIKNFIISLVRVKSFLSPVMFGIGIQLHRKYASRYLIDVLAALGVSVSYSECLAFESSAIINHKDSVCEESFVQFVYDNADFNIRTIDGHETFHSMGGIMCCSPSNSSYIQSVPRPKHRIQASNIGRFGSVRLQVYKKPAKAGLSRVEMKCMQEERSTNDENLAFLLDTLWITGKVLSFPSVSWSGFMSTLKSDSLNIDTSIIPLPFINLDPGNLNTIYTALLFAAEKSKQYGKPCIVTFDQPLFQKAVDVVEASNSSDTVSSVILRLGGFHTLMSFMGSVGKIMAGSGIEELLETVYAKNTVPHMMSGHAYSRALRGHLLIYEALILIMLDDPEILSLSENDIQIIQNFYNNPDLDTIEQNELLIRIQTKVYKKVDDLANTSRTGKLWANYWSFINIIKLFISAERMGIWWLHIHCVKCMIPLFYATGHYNYAKCAHLYLLQMEKLKSINDDEYQRFVNRGLFTIRRTNKFWSGTWSDMVIEQSLMRAMKTQGGLTQGRGFADSSLARWISSTSSCIPICISLEEFVEVKSVSSDQHIDLTNARQRRNESDLNKIFEWLQDHNPFKCSKFMSISTGLIASSIVNCDKAKDIGEDIFNNHIGKKFTDIQCKRKENIKNFASMNSCIKLNKTYVDFNPMQLFNRIICSNKSPEEIKQCFKYELSPYPLSLFKDGNLRKGTKSQLLQELDKINNPGSSPHADTVYVIDGGFLLHKVSWQRPATYDDIFLQYVSYVICNYNKDCVIIFDGYCEATLSTKDSLQRCRSKGALEISIHAQASVIIPQEDFLKNNRNKLQFIKILRSYFEKVGIIVHQAERDADFLIALTAVDLAKSKNHVTVVSEDTDIMVLLIHHSRSDNISMIRPGKAAKGDKISRIYDIQEKLGDLTKYILFLHAISGCDTTSFLFNKSKKMCLSLLKNENNLDQNFHIFLDRNAEKKDLIQSGLNYLLKMYRCPKHIKDINHLRYISYNRVASRQGLKSTFNLASLPPTEDAAQQHVLRTYFQIQEWIGNNLNPLDYGWKKDEQGNLIPVQCMQNVAPPDLLKLIFCNCKESQCSKNCSCRRLGLKCSSKCGQCYGISCTIFSFLADDDEVEDDVIESET